MVAAARFKFRYKGDRYQLIQLWLQNSRPAIVLNVTIMKSSPGPPMTLGNMRELGVQNLIASCLNDACMGHLIETM